MTDAVLALNAGSSSIKFGLFGARAADGPVLIAKGLLEDQGSEPHFTVRDPAGATLVDRQWSGATAHEDLLGALLEWVETHLDGKKLAAVGHRIVHGGLRFVEPVRLTDETIAAIDDLTPLAPLHQPRSLEPIRALRTLRPDLPQVGCFDTAFHHNLAPPVSRYAVPRRFEEAGVRKYGFHGLSYHFIAGRLAEVAPELVARRTVVAHLGNGASLCAMRDGRSRDTTMGFTALDGLVMGTRCGAIDPGVVLHLQKQHGMSADAVEHMLYHEAGLLGVSGLSSDMRTLAESDDPRAHEAIDLFGFHVARETAAMANTLGGLDALVFTGGIGEHSAAVRADVCARLVWLGVEIDTAANDQHSERLATPTSRVEVLCLATDEEIVIARAALHPMG
ncbi:acetate/propionate family kinase [Lichenihabitans sp. PAMC28606]|uniref:acetate/propionate family kinase n=1 Tax=Lichenihabitans sp. PAMC28606 TaxID=2880932 RepID=UPI001D0A64AE|nr:acetate/propionate family kinase [Lichenihabitans sp. PAMC28606]UDL94348.1 acetate/propionate family kinase [Lichenihabitans sp. PAMC28606]